MCACVLGRELTRYRCALSFICCVNYGTVMSNSIFIEIEIEYSKVTELNFSRVLSIIKKGTKRKLAYEFLREARDKT